MQIHEIFRRNTNEGILKGVRATPPRNDRGRFMPRAATGAFSNMATQLQNRPAASPPPATPAPAASPAAEPPNPYMSAFATPSPTPTAPTASAPSTTTTPNFGQKISGYGKQTYNVPTGVKLPTQAAPVAATAQPAPAAAPWTPTNPNVKPGGSKEAQAFQAQQAAKKTTATPTATSTVSATPATPGKAGFMRNAAEYFANKTLNKAGVPVSQQGEYHPGGHMAASMGRGNTTIRKAELEIADKLASEWMDKKTLNGRPSSLKTAEIQGAATLINQAAQNLPLNLNNIVALTYRRAQEIQQQKAIEDEKQAKEQMHIDSLIDMLKTAEQQQRANDAQKIADQLRQLGVPANDIRNIRSNIAADAQKIAAGTDINKMLTKQSPAAVPAPSTDQLRGAKPGAPTTQDYANLEKRLQQAMAAQGQTA